MRNYSKYFAVAAVLTLFCLELSGQNRLFGGYKSLPPERKEIRAGNKQFKKGEYADADIDYRKALAKDTTSLAAGYNLANTLYRQENYEEAGKALEKMANVAATSEYGADYYHNLGNVACQKKDWSAAVEAYKQSLLRRPEDMETKENYAYAKLMLENQQGGGGGGQNQNDQNQQNQDQNQNGDGQQDQQDQNQDQQDQNGQQNPEQGQNPQDQQGQQEPKISSQQAQQMLNAIQAKEKETQDKVNKEKAAKLKSRQKEKNW